MTTLPDNIPMHLLATLNLHLHSFDKLVKQHTNKREKLRLCSSFVSTTIVSLQAQVYLT